MNTHRIHRKYSKNDESKYKTLLLWFGYEPPPPLTHVLNTLFLAGYTIWGAVETLEV